MKILLVSSEAVPFAKTGGLADVSGALPRALARLDSPSRPAPPQTAKMAMMNVAMTIHRVGANDLTFLRIAFNMVSPRIKCRVESTPAFLS